MLSNFFNFDSLAIVVTILILFISLIVISYSRTYLRGDRKNRTFSILVCLIACFLIITFSANNIFVMALSWMVSNLLLVAAITHKASWKQAVESGLLALRNFTIGFVALIAALTILCLETGNYQISEIIVSDHISSNGLIISCLLILVAALSQSAIYPFNSWLLSSLNSPTPASALMHAGIVNGGGIILARFSPLFFKMPDILTLAFIIGITSAIVGTLWKLIQSNVKAMLACSTMSQMGFMIAQCAMGLFPAAIAHLFWHGMFKSYLFLSSPGSWQEKRLDLKYPVQLSSFLASLICGVCGAFMFAQINHIKFSDFQTTLVLVAMCFIAASQVAVMVIDRSVIKNFIPALLLSLLVSTTYAYSVFSIEKIISGEFFKPQHLNFWHLAATLIMFIFWMVRLFWANINFAQQPILLKFYVKALNASQPKSQTITSNRNQYDYR